MEVYYFFSWQSKVCFKVINVTELSLSENNFKTHIRSMPTSLSYIFINTLFNSFDFALELSLYVDPYALIYSQ